MPNPIQSADFAEAASSLATPEVGSVVAATDPTPTDKYLSPADVAATKAAEAATPPDAGALEGVVDPAAKPVVADPAAPGAPVAAVSGKTAPPADRWDSILENARKKAKEETEAEYAWAKDLQKDDVEATRKWITLGNQNPLLALDQLVQGIIRNNPAQKTDVERYFKTILQVAGPEVAAAAAGAAATASDADPMPPPDIPTDTSNGVPVVYSDKQMLLRDQWFTRQIKKEVKADYDKELAPIRAEREQAATERKQVADQKAIDDYTEMSIGAIASRPGYEKYRAEIATVYAAMPTDGKLTEGEKLRDAYLQVITDKMSEDARAEAVASVNRRADAGTVNPSSQGASAPFDYKNASWEQALRHEFNTAALGR